MLHPKSLGKKIIRLSCITMETRKRTKNIKSNPVSFQSIMVRSLPFLKWFKGYTFSHLRIDLVSGVTVALVLIPQSMAYAQLAGLPAYYGLYAAFLPPMVASLFGSSNQLATGPVAVVSLMTAIALEPLATSGGPAYISYAVLLALAVGVFQLGVGMLRLGLIVNFLSHPVVNGFTNAAAIIIATSQMPKFFGVYVDKAEHHYETVYNVIRAAIDYTHWPTLILALLAIAMMVGLKRLNSKIPNVLIAVIVTTLISMGIGFEHNHKTSSEFINAPEAVQAIRTFNDTLAKIKELRRGKVAVGAEIANAKKRLDTHSVELTKLNHQLDFLNFSIKELQEKSYAYRAKLRLMKFEAVKEGNDVLRYYPYVKLPSDVKSDGRKWRLKVGYGQLDEKSLIFLGGGDVVGVIPEGLPRLSMPEFDFSALLSFLPMVVIITLLGFMEAFSIAKAMAAKTGQHLDPNQELIGQGLANIAGAIGQSYPVSGSFSRSAVNLQTGALTGLSNVFSSCIVVITLLFFTPLFYHLPQSVLASIIMMAVIGLINVRSFIAAWRVHKHDGIISIITFVTTLIFAPHLERGIFIGIFLSIGLYLFRTMKPSISVLSRYTDGSYRNAEIWGLSQCRYIAVVRFNGSLFFINASYLEEKILEQVSKMPELNHIHIVGNAINEIDASGEETLSSIVTEFRQAGFDISFSGLNDSVINVLKRTGLYNKIGEQNFFRYVADALEIIHDKSHVGGDEDLCPLITSVLKGLKVSLEEKQIPEISKGL